MFIPTKEQHPDYETKIKPIAGNCLEKNMGMSAFDRSILENEVNIVFHVAATVHFTTPLKEATYTNVGALDTLLDMAKNMKNLKASR